MPARSLAFSSTCHTFFGGGDIETLGGLFGHNQPRATEKFAGQYHFLKVSAGKLTGFGTGVGRLDIKVLDELCEALFGLAPLQPRARGQNPWRVVSKKLSVKDK